MPEFFFQRRKKELEKVYRGEAGGKSKRKEIVHN
jgi:hypothetical protein